MFAPRARVAWAVAAVMTVVTLSPEAAAAAAAVEALEAVKLVRLDSAFCLVAPTILETEIPPLLLLRRRH